MPTLHTALVMTLSAHFALGKSQLFSLAVLITGLAQSRTVNLTHPAGHLPASALYASHYRRLQRFFQFVRLDTDRMALLVVHMLNLEQPKCFALDRTNWKIGSTDVNILMLAIVTRRFRVPLLWTLLPHQGNSDTASRIALMRRYLALFPVTSIECLIADREFIGAAWMDFLNQNNIPFVIRVKADMCVTLQTGQTCSLKTLLTRKRARRATPIWQAFLNGTGGPRQTLLHFVARQLKTGEWLIIATNRQDARQALNDYRKRWAIECLFGDAKTRGLNIEDTRIRSADKLACLLVIVTLAMTWAYRCATACMGMKAIARKAHADAQNHGSASALMHSEAGSQTPNKKQFAHGSKNAQNDHVYPSEMHESCTVGSIRPRAVILCFYAYLGPKTGAHFWETCFSQRSRVNLKRLLFSKHCPCAGHIHNNDKHFSRHASACSHHKAENPPFSGFSKT